MSNRKLSKLELCFVSMASKEAIETITKSGGNVPPDLVDFKTICDQLVANNSDVAKMQRLWTLSTTQNVLGIAKMESPNATSFVDFVIDKAIAEVENLPKLTEVSSVKESSSPLGDIENFINNKISGLTAFFN